LGNTKYSTKSQKLIFKGAARSCVEMLKGIDILSSRHI